MTDGGDHRFPCAQCGASLRFRPGQQRLVCDWCGHEQDIAPTRAGLAEIPLAQGLDLDAASPILDAVRELACPQCGARVMADATHHASACPFCATPVVSDAGASRRIAPQAVLPFALTEDQARAAMKAWLGGLWFAPSRLAAYARKDRRLTGVYSPFWTFDADTVTTYRGQRGDAYYVTVTVTQTVNGRPQPISRQERRIRWTPVTGRVARQFDDLPVAASSALPQRFADGMQPWDLDALTGFDPGFLSGFEAELYTIPLADAHQVARDRMARVIRQDVQRDIGGAEQRIEHVDSRHANEGFKHVLLPLWMAAYRYNGRSYRMVVNGRTGKVMGDRPWSVWKISAAVAAALVALAAILYLTQ